MPIRFDETLPKTSGSYLKKLREKQNLTLKNVAHETKIKLPHLQAIEQDDICSKLETSYARIIILKYGRFLNANIEELLSRFENQYIKKGAINKKSISNNNEKTGSKVLISSKSLSIIAVFIIVGVIFAFGLYLNENINLQRDIFSQENANQNSSAKDSTAIVKTKQDNKVWDYKTQNYLRQYLVKNNTNKWYVNPVFIKNRNGNNGIPN